LELTQVREQGRDLGGVVFVKAMEPDPLAEVIAAKVEVGLSARRICQDLVEQNGFRESYLGAAFCSQA
jgi:hypothetical protein